MDRTRSGVLLRGLGLFSVMATLVVSVAGSAPYGLSAQSRRAMAALGVPGVFVGEGSKVLSVWIEPGVWIFRTDHQGSADLVATLQSQEIQYSRDLSQKAESGPQLSWVSITQADLYRLVIVTEGPWRIDVKGCTCAAESG